MTAPEIRRSYAGIPESRRIRPVANLLDRLFYAGGSGLLGDGPMPMKRDGNGLDRFRVFSVLVFMAANVNERGETYHGQAYIAGCVGMHRQRVAECLYALERLGLITRAGKVRRAIRYVVLPELWAELTAQPTGDGIAAADVSAHVSAHTSADVSADVSADMSAPADTNGRGRGSVNGRTSECRTTPHAPTLASLPPPPETPQKLPKAPPERFEQQDPGCDRHGWNDTAEPCRGCMTAKARRATDEPVWRDARSRWEADERLRRQQLERQEDALHRAARQDNRGRVSQLAAEMGQRWGT